MVGITRSNFTANVHVYRVFIIVTIRQLRDQTHRTGDRFRTAWTGHHLVSEDEIIHMWVGIALCREVHIVASVFAKRPVSEHTQQMLLDGQVVIDAQITRPRHHFSRILGVASS